MDRKATAFVATETSLPSVFRPLARPFVRSFVCHLILLLLQFSRTFDFALCKVYQESAAEAHTHTIFIERWTGARESRGGLKGWSANAPEGTSRDNVSLFLPPLLTVAVTESKLGKGGRAVEEALASSWNNLVCVCAVRRWNRGPSLEGKGRKGGRGLDRMHRFG